MTSNLLLALSGAAFVSCLSPAGLAQTTTFTDVTASAGVTAQHSPAYFAGFAAGGAVGDFDRDGFQDIFFATGGNAPDRLFINNGDGTFTDRAMEWGVGTPHRGTGGTVGDFDGDGWLDLFVTSLGPASNDAIGHHKLYRNIEGRAFVDVAPAMNVSSTGTTDGWGGAFGDYDNDGDLDLAVCGWRTGATNKLFRNDGTTFVDVTVSSGLAPAFTSMSGFAAKFVDMDGDVDVDLIWIGDFGTSRYFVNNGDGTFTDFTAQSGTSQDGTEMGVTVADVNEDGMFDFYVTTISTNNLYINQGGNVFVNQANAAGVSNTAWGWGTVAIDMNHDTLIDLVATTQSSQQFAFRNVSPTPQSMQFQQVAQSIGLTTTVSGRGLSNIDYDNDGDQDLVFFPSNGPMRLYRNDLSSADTHWLRVFLDDGCASTIPPDGVGAIVKATVGGRTWMRPIEAGCNYLSNSELSAHFGLGASTSVDTLTVEWPDGQVTTISNVAADQTLTVRAPADSACVSAIGAGCPGSNGVPSLSAQVGSVPALGATFALDLGGLSTSGGAAALAFAFSRQAPPLDLGIIGMSGCDYHVGSLAATAIPVVNVGGSGTWSVGISTDPVLQGLAFYLQGLSTDAGAPNPIGIALSNALRAIAY